MKKVIKLVAAAVLAFGIVFSVTGCEDEKYKPYVTTDYEYRFNMRYYPNNDTYIIIDTETGVQYLCFAAGGMVNGIGMTLLVNADGTPMLVEGY